MSNRSVLVALLLALLVGESAFAQTTRQKGFSSNEAKIKALYDSWAKAFEAKDIDAIMAIYARGDAVISRAVPGGQVRVQC